MQMKCAFRWLHSNALSRVNTSYLQDDVSAAQVRLSDLADRSSVSVIYHTIVILKINDGAVK
jgi:hypothetical protein